MAGIDDAFLQLPDGWRYHVGHTPHWYQRDELPKHLRRRPFEAYVCNGERMGTKAYIFESADGATAAEAMSRAIALGRSKMEPRP
jgi:hypothetical protein